MSQGTVPLMSWVFSSIKTECSTQQKYLLRHLFDSKPNPCPLFLIQSLSSLAHKPQDVSDYSLKLEL